ncbi:MAG: dimethyl sulfoxide reductase anchor subunit [Alphaproteobacteria bacterium]|nr:dimethyl sulfoxide reductase anchor subunit [Alphaproteobacteria bacterium]
MHPALSIVFFTTASGAGYGLLVLVAWAALIGHHAPQTYFGITGIAVGLGLVGAGLLSSLGHLGHPERAWRALTQWRSSWLSREGVMALLTFLPALFFAWRWVVADQIASLAAWLTILGAALTTICTAMIYASLKPVRAWRNLWTVPIYLVLALYTGGLLTGLLLNAYGLRGPFIPFFVSIAGILGAVLKIGYWAFLDGGRSSSTPENATGLGAIGKVKMLDPPNTEANYLLKEMGYRVARKHAGRLRLIVLVLGFAVPIGLSVLTLYVGAVAATLFSLIAVVSGAIGILAERWLFFAEAKHTVTLYYGASRA